MVKKEEEKKVEKKEKVSKKLSEADYEKRILELAKEGLTSEKIGEKLRQEGIHTKEHGKKVSVVLKKNNKYVNPDLKNIENKLENLRKHVEKNKQDKRSMRERERVASQLRKQQAYFKVN